MTALSERRHLTCDDTSTSLNPPSQSRVTIALAELRLFKVCTEPSIGYPNDHEHITASQWNAIADETPDNTMMRQNAVPYAK
jgi:hypothetical protein